VICKLAQQCETKFWECLIPVLAEKGPMNKLIEWFKQIFYTKIGYFTLLLFVWAAVGFVLGMIVGKVIWFLQIG
jgi:hypothetical protein